jgi:hypothetical protein
MNTQPLEMITNVTNVENIGLVETDTDILQKVGFSDDEIISLLWLQQWYQHGGSDRVEVLRHLEFLKLLIGNGSIDR